MAELNERAAKESGIRILDMGWWYGERHLTTKTKQVAKPEDVKGLKIRTMDSPMAKAALVALGAATTPMAVAELYTALQLGVVEGQENPLNTIYSHKFYEVQKYVALTGHMAMNLVLVTNEKFYQGLSPELRAIFVKSMQDAGDYESEMQIGMNKQNLQDLKDKGMTVTVVNKADFAEKTKDAWKEFEPTSARASTRRSSKPQVDPSPIRWDEVYRASPLLSSLSPEVVPDAADSFLGEYFEEIVAGMFMVLMSLTTFANVVARYVFNSPIQWAEEFSRYAFIWVVFLGGGGLHQAQAAHRHRLLVTVLPSHMRRG